MGFRFHLRAVKLGPVVGVGRVAQWPIRDGCTGRVWWTEGFSKFVGCVNLQQK